MNLKNYSFGLFVIMVFVFIYSCKHDPDEIIVPDPGNGNPPPFDTIACDSSNVTYPGTVFPILNAYCISCHGGPTPQGGLDFTNYSQLSYVAENGSLIGSILHLPPYSPMPQNGPALTDCETSIIQKWINDTTFTGSGGFPCDPDTVYFQNTVLPLLQSSCAISGCHDEISHQHGIIMTTYEKIIQTVEINPYEPWDSELYEVIEDDYQSDRMPPPPSPPFTQEQKDIIYNWILQGSLDNYCDSEDCDSINVSFSGTIFPIIQNNCYGCHSGSNPNGGISLTNYSQIKNAGSISPGSFGSLLGTVTWANGNSPMPQNGNKLSDCNIAQINKWIVNGMPDN